MNKIKKNADWWCALKQLWNQFDPIGVLGEGSDCPDDEYESYIVPTFTLLEKGVDFAELNNYISFTVKEHIGVALSDESIADFVSILQRWYAQYNSDVCVTTCTFKSDEN